MKKIKDKIMSDKCPKSSDYPSITREHNTPSAYMAFLKLQKIKFKDVDKDSTFTAYEDNWLTMFIDLDKKGKPCGVEILYRK